MADGTMLDAEAALGPIVAEMAKQVMSLTGTVQTVAGKLEDRVSHKDFMQQETANRKEFLGQLTAMEGRLAAGNTAHGDRIKADVDGMIERAVARGIAAERLREQEARQNIERSDADVDKRIRNANRNGFGGVVIGLLSLGYAVAKGQGWAP